MWSSGVPTLATSRASHTAADPPRPRIGGYDLSLLLGNSGPLKMRTQSLPVASDSPASNAESIIVKDPER